jgi:hypothetical protein
MGSHCSYLFYMLYSSFTMRMSSFECECECFIFYFTFCIVSMLLDEYDSQLSRGYFSFYKYRSTADVRLPFLDIGPCDIFLKNLEK